MPGPIMIDGQLQFQNLIDAILDAFYSALEKVLADGGKSLYRKVAGRPDGGQAASLRTMQTFQANYLVFDCMYHRRYRSKLNSEF
ncbi:hypothetical protein HPP92_006437 [Vanilla planifolia]|uniref:Uncharacterized protein n=1 Tax=Vanilla planifolia TaxID=51239 RepID=A0A835RED7_VANPL|nr:hypothetical protein HPP92_006437 [Vanilla planifolia]